MSGIRAAFACSSTTSIVLDHAGIDVDDLEAQVAFYATAFGLEVEHRQDLPQYDFEYVMLKSASGWRLELFKRDGAAPRPVPDDPDGQHGVLGATSRIPPSPSPVPGVVLAYLADPEGDLIELLSAH